jgi:hypothetical protein
MTAYPPTPFPRKGATSVQPLRVFHVLVFTRPWGGPAGG